MRNRLLITAAAALCCLGAKSTPQTTTTKRWKEATTAVVPNAQSELTGYYIIPDPQSAGTNGQPSVEKYILLVYSLIPGLEIDSYPIKITQTESKIYQDGVLIYDFSAQAGDSVYVGEYKLGYKVVSVTGTVGHRQLVLAYQGVEVTWVEGIGDLRGFTKSTQNPQIKGVAYDLVCVTDGDSLVYSNAKYPNCEPLIPNSKKLTTTTKRWKEESEAVIPNPHPRFESYGIKPSAKLTLGDGQYRIDTYDLMGYSTANGTETVTVIGEITHSADKIYRDGVLIYDFCAKVGEKILLGDTLVEFTVTEVTGEPGSRTMKLQSENATKTWIEGIGDMRGFTKSTLDPLTLGVAYSLVCVTDGDSLVYSNAKFPKCGEVPVIEKFEVTGNAHNPSKSGADGYIKISATGGVQPYSFIWTNGATTQEISGLSAGVYSVSASDSNGDTTVIGYFISESSYYGRIDTTYSRDTLSVHLGTSNLNGQSIGILTDAKHALLSKTVIVGGEMYYQYIPEAGYNGFEQLTFSVTRYPNEVVDTICLDITVPKVSPGLNVQSNVGNASIHGAADGYIDLTVTGGTATHAYQWSNGATTEDIYGLVAGTYELTITEADGGTFTETYTVGVDKLGTSTIGGTIYSGTQQLGGGVVMLFRKEAGAFMPECTVAVTDSGVFRIDNLPKGDYLLYAIPAPTAAGTVIPTYAYSALLAKDAYILSLEGQVTHFDIKLIDAAEMLAGTGSISGHITLDDSLLAASNMYSNELFGSATKSGSIAGSANLVVTLLADGKPVAWALTDKNGAYSFTNLPLGSYAVQVERPGADASRLGVTLTAEQPSVSTMDAAITRSAVVTSELLYEHVLISLFPNPATDIVHFGGAEAASVTVTDLSGAVVARAEKTNSISVAQLVKGYYTLTITTQGSHYALSLIKE